MRIAIISDIHGNLVALEALLANIERERSDQIVCLGDVAALGPQPRETVERLRGLSGLVVMGNTDAWLLNPRPSAPTDENARRIEEIELWCAKQLSPAALDYLRTFKPTIEMPLSDDTTLLCFHGSPRSNTDVILSRTPEEDLDRMLAGFRASIMAGGHTHMPMLRRHRETIIINPGSVGLPHERAWQTNEVRNPPWAEYALIDGISGKLSIELRRVPLDLNAVKQAALDSDMPHAEWWAGDWR
jgi:predicted phosphodiesterase